MENIQNGNNMEENKVTYEQLTEAYTKLAQEHIQLQNALQQIQFDKSNERFKMIVDIVSNQDKFSKKIVKLAEWHLQKMLAKPKKSK